MKRILIFASILIAIVSCTKVAVPQTQEDSYGESAFKEGQEVTLTVSTAQTRVTSEVNGSNVDFKWEGGDKIKVSVGSASSEFILASGAGNTTATFVGTMPADGNTFDVQFPTTDPDLSYQVYSPSTGPFPHNKAKFAATGCTVGNAFTLTPQYAALQLNIYGTAMTVGKIVVTNTSSTDNPKPSYTLDCGSGVTVGYSESTATTFIFVIPGGNYALSADIFDNAATPDSICTFTTSAPVTLAASQVLNMAAKEIKPLYLPGLFTIGKGDDGLAGTSDDVKVHFSVGNLQATYNSSTSSYDWGFAANQYDYIGNTAGNTTIGSQSNGKVVDLFGWSTPSTDYGINTSTTKSDYSGNFRDWGGITTLPANSGGDMWRSLSALEWYSVISNRSASTIGSQANACCAEVKVNGICGLLLFPDTFSWPDESITKPTTFNAYCEDRNGVNYSVDQFKCLENAGCVFLPAAGQREGSGVYMAGSSGTYWTSSPRDSDLTESMDFHSSTGMLKATSAFFRYRGFSVRLVTSAQ